MNNFSYIQSTYSVPAEFGRKVIVDGKSGIIVADNGHYIGVNFDHHKAGVISNCHPTWRVQYKEIGEVRRLTRSQKRYQKYLDEGDQFESFKHFLDWETDKRSIT